MEIEFEFVRDILLRASVETLGNGKERFASASREILIQNHDIARLIGETISVEDIFSVMILALTDQDIV